MKTNDGTKFYCAGVYGGTDPLPEDCWEADLKVTAYLCPTNLAAELPENLDEMTDAELEEWIATELEEGMTAAEYDELVTETVRMIEEQAPLENSIE